MVAAAWLVGMALFEIFMLLFHRAYWLFVASEASSHLIMINDNNDDHGPG